MTDRPVRRTSWGFRDFDTTVGPIVEGRLYVIGARPSNGKSTFLLNLLDHWINAEKVKVLVYWTELSPYVAYRCWAAMRLGLPEDDVLMGSWAPYEKWEFQFQGERYIGADYAVDRDVRNLQDCCASPGEWIMFRENGRPTLDQIQKDVGDLQPDIVILDYIQRIGRTKVQDKFQAVADAAVGLQTLALEKGISVIATSQFRRKGDDVLDKYRAPSLEDFKLAGEIEEAADVAVGLFRLLRHDFSRKDEENVRSGNQALADFAIPNTMGVRVLKHRYRGPAADAMIRLRIDGKRLSDHAPAWREKLPPDAGDAWEGAA